MRLGGSVVFVLVLVAAGCGAGGDAGNNKKLTDLEKRVAALEKEIRGDKADKADKADKSGKEKRARGERGERRKAAVDRGKVDLAGDAVKVALVKDGSRIDLPGAVPVGTWEIFARFGGGDDDKVQAGSVTVAKGQTLTIECTAASKSCVTR